ncbi:pentatricopeptide repeat-containing protein At2g17670 [Ricinus communis]|uniref:Pentatricopeptide repeat-containing protein, putative n=1 Tax=Ricinus communis TaxID=3988 RepID=B9S6R2_RICCO|nr:pentatricopeptide repeat-containing protein At2g17670 [Ricinus communis]EEF40668.1 pentatricopeptide repeat-containing protein, putative [Ricinus communis]|eukprot:XP_002521681.1 pentatricopeptide repeat-containing protein At2g17670 [Ricinus communis]
MGKVPPSLRSAVSTTALLRKPNPFPPPEKPHYLSKKTKLQLSQKIPTPIQQKRLFKSPELNEAKEIFNSLISTTRVPLDLRFHHSFLQSYSSISTIDDSISLLRHMIKTLPSFTPTISTYHILLSQSCKAPDPTLSPVHQILNLMVNNGFMPTQVTVDIAVRALCSAGKEDDAVKLVKELSLKHSKPDSFTYNFLVKCLCKCRALSNVYSFIDEMRSSFDLEPNLVTYTILIDNVCNSKNLREAMRLLGILRECGFKPDCFVYNTIMKGYCMLSKGSDAIQVFKKMKEEGIEPDLITYNTLIFGLSKGGRVSEAKRYLKIMVESGHFPDAVTYTSLMNGLCRKGDALGALALLEDMEMKGCSPNSCTYNTLLYGLCKERLLEKGIELYNVIKEGGMLLDTASYATFVRALCREGKVAEAYEVFDYAVESKSLTNAAAYTTLESTLKWLKKAREQGLSV